MQQFFSLLSWRLFTAQHVSGVFPPIIRRSMTAVAASGFTFVSWWQPCCVRGRASRPDHEHSTAITTCWACCECRVLSGRGLCDELITRPEESYRLCCVVVCNLETSRIGAPYIYVYVYDISSLRVNDLTLILLTWRKWWAPNNASK